MDAGEARARAVTTSQEVLSLVEERVLPHLLDAHKSDVEALARGVREIAACHEAERRRVEAAQVRFDEADGRRAEHAGVHGARRGHGR